MRNIIITNVDLLETVEEQRIIDFLTESNLEYVIDEATEYIGVEE